MKKSIQTSISIVAIALSSVSFAQAGEYRGDRNYDKPRQERSQRQENRRKDSNRVIHRDHRYAERRHYRKHIRAERKARRQLARHKRFNRQAKRHFRAYQRARKHNWKKRSYYRSGQYGYHSKSSDYIAPSYSSHVRVSRHHNSGDVVPVLAGTLIGSAIANDASGGDPVATIGGAVFGAIIGNAIVHH